MNNTKIKVNIANAYLDCLAQICFSEESSNCKLDIPTENFSYIMELSGADRMISYVESVLEETKDRDLIIKYATFMLSAYDFLQGSSWFTINRIDLADKLACYNLSLSEQNNMMSEVLKRHMIYEHVFGFEYICESLLAAHETIFYSK